MNARKARKTIEPLLQDAIFALCLQDWRVRITWGLCTDASDDARPHGQCFTEPRYRRATLEVDHDTHDTKRSLENTVRHELLHVLHASFVEYKRGVDAAHHSVAFSGPVRVLYQVACEETVTHLEAVLDGLGLDLRGLAREGKRQRRAWAGEVVDESPTEP